MTENLRAFYSPEMARTFPDTIIYYRDKDGNEIECTCVGVDGKHGTKWSDIQDRGEVVEFVRRKYPALYSPDFSTVLTLDSWDRWRRP